jgi:hypothetical protein
MTWLDDEAKSLEIGGSEIERLPSVKFETGKILTLEIDATAPFKKWHGKMGDKDITKAVIPCVVNGERRNLWMNIRNPTYREIVNKVKDGTTTIKMTMTGSQADTRYQLLEE